MYTRTITTAGELAQVLRGIPEDVPLHIISHASAQNGVNVGYGTDPNNLSRCIVLMNLDLAKTNGAQS